MSILEIFSLAALALYTYLMYVKNKSVLSQKRNPTSSSMKHNRNISDV